MSAPEVVTHSDLEVAAGQNGGRVSNWPTLKPGIDYRHLPQPEYRQPEFSYPDPPPPEPVARTSTICGIPSKMFFAVLGIVILVLGIGLGAGVGAGMSIQRGKQTATPSSPSITVTQTVTVTSAAASATSSSSSSTSNFSPTTLINAVIPTNGTVALNCPSIDASTIRIPVAATTFRFAVTCGTDTVSTNQDILAIIVYSIEACAEACASYNHNYGSNKCVAATFNSNLTSSVGKDLGTCWLKNGTVGGVASTSNYYAGLRLQT